MKKKILFYLMLILTFSIALGISKYYVESILNRPYHWHAGMYSFWVIPLAFVSSCFSYKFLPQNKRILLTLLIWIISVGIVNYTCLTLTVKAFSFPSSVVFSYFIQETYDKIRHGILIASNNYNYKKFLLILLINILMYILSIVICIVFSKNKYSAKPNKKRIILEDSNKKGVAFYIAIIVLASVALGFLDFYVFYLLFVFGSISYYMIEAIPLALIICSFSYKYVSKNKRILFTLAMWVCSMWLSSIAYTSIYYCKYDPSMFLNNIGSLYITAPYVGGIVSQIYTGVQYKMDYTLIAGICNLGMVFISILICILFSKNKYNVSKRDIVYV